MARCARQAYADVTLDLSEALGCFGLGHEALQDRLGNRSWKVLVGKTPYVLKLAAPNGAARLRNEARCLRDLADRTVAECPTALLVEYVEGKPMRCVAEHKAALEACLDALHVTGYVFCDLKPSNVIVSGGKCHLVDWEFCTRAGTAILDMLTRPYSSGFTHPDLIWGRGDIAPHIDFFSLERMLLIEN